MSEYVNALKVGATALMLELLEERIVPDVELLDPVKAIRDISRDLSYRWEVQLKDGTLTTAGDIQYKYLAHR